MNKERPGCLGGIVRLLLLAWAYEFLQERLGWGRGCSISGVGCGCLLLLLFLFLLCSILWGTDWTRLTWYPLALGGLLG